MLSCGVGGFSDSDFAKGQGNERSQRCDNTEYNG
ncbi:hypothetical protein NB724_001760 [Pantoea ananatis]|jgi:hypothetical protein|uniref:Uncharacterized protein n=1 Tax=Pantoea ananas TaxID=553 RepID=A0AAJ1D0P7_PANAN|nr:hypothetical protein [Pantoea ananatis]MCW0313750.1 hypothetical protein [Pantoea ananatis]MCW0316609.1 hypothetical protein [Pantoea ananatis]MCW0332387.1 hypothetical protein [Pantoea ananatis]MCW0335190.1 hypothetical protein [Pantoea ananatis]